MKLFIKWIASNETLESNIFTANLDKTSVNNLVCFYFVLLNNFVWPLECEYQEDLLEYLSIVKLVLKRWPDNQSSCFLQIYYFSVAYLTWNFAFFRKGELKMEYKNGSASDSMRAILELILALSRVPWKKYITYFNQKRKIGVLKTKQKFMLLNKNI